MGRIRTVKPELFKHGGLYDAEHETKLPLRLAFIALLTCCDREGRFKWRPRELKLDCLPFDGCDFGHVLDALAASGMVVKYEVEGQPFGHVPTFHKHQTINLREAKSSIPAPDQGTVMHVHAHARTVTDTNDACGEGKGKEGKGKELEGKGREPERGGVLPFESEEFASAVQDWEKHRAEIKHKLTPTQREKWLKECETIGERRAIAAINHSIARGYQGMFEPKLSDQPATDRMKATIMDRNNPGPSLREYMAEKAKAK